MLTGLTADHYACALKGHPVLWLNILSFRPVSILIKAAAAKRFALWFPVKFDHNASSVFFNFMFIFTYLLHHSACY